MKRIASLAVLFLLLSSACRTAPASALQSIAAARSASQGERVTVSGIVTVPSSAFLSSLEDHGFALQDASGGIYVSTTLELDLEPGEIVEITARRGDSHGAASLVLDDPRSISRRGRTPPPLPRDVPTGRIGEETEGWLVRVTGRLLRPPVSDLPYGWRLFLDDGSGEIQAFVAASTAIDVSAFAEGATLVVTGLSSQYDDHYEVAPRMAGDVR
ncbi:MAG TPA: hypothetical protein VMT00_05430 [Thermoanaerobaculia bacterium]|nr:hypothetical protein [Thermoanaerobaculia bacterium]